MATTYVGFFGVTDSAAPVLEAAARETGSWPQEFIDKVNGFPGSFPDGLRLVGSWGVAGGERPGVTVVEADDFAALSHVNNYYNGWLQFEWHATATGGVARDQ